MHFVIDIPTLRKATSILQGVSEKKSGIPVLASLLFDVEGEYLTITATDLDVTLRTKLLATVKEEGSVCINAKRVYDILRSLKEGQITFKKDDNDWVRLTAGKSKFRIQGLNKEHFPKLAEIEGDTLSIGADTLKYFIKHTIFAVSEEVNKFTLGGAKLEVADNNVKMIATDGLRVAVVSKDFLTDVVFDCLIPRNALTDLEKFVKDDVLITNSQNHISFESGMTTLTSRKLSGAFPDYRLALPKDNNIKVNVDATLLAEALRRVSLVADESAKAVTIELKEKELKISASSNGEAEEVLDAEYENFKNVSIILNWKFLVDFLDECKNATIKLKDAVSAIELADEGALCVLMPLRK